MIEIQIVKLGQIVQFRNGVNFSQADEGRGIPILKVKDFGARHTVPIDGLDELERGKIAVPESQMLAPNDIVIIRSNGNRELVGRSMIYAGPPNRITFSGFCIRARVNSDRALPSYLHYWLRSPLTRQTFSREGNGTGIQNISQSFLCELSAPLPRLDVQNEIVEILGSLDNKIELNQRMNETLEAMAQAIFRDWFVDFGPTRRKIGGATDPIEVIGGLVTDLGRAKQLADLFPASLGDDGIPVGWRTRKVADVADRVAMGPFGSRITKDNFVSHGVPVIRGKNLTEGFVDHDFVYLIPEKANELSTSQARHEDIVFTHRGTLGQVGRIYPGSRYPAYIVSQSQLLLSVDRTQTSPLFLYFFFRSEDGQRKWLANSGGAGVPAIAQPTRSLKSIEFVDPGSVLAQRFDACARMLEDRARSAKRESETLGSMRDLLLPKLMSGEIRLREAEKQLEAAQ
ncbi:restriction endonuclease subunit S [Mesorhizobium sp. M4A.F.Ca.ET.022.05.2.1]|uniref:restriction endonuclease subunit S n=1 Tax=Mesorhizobium sp. M4A.F.Ca.ET.022.05.2.1 TaxID=2496653 RepID=UPI000FC9FC0F|nr:restriction endonuclease subunit S [Mesorhizobium sp. M4A.F.Ca.ET.022.05.2.1]RVC79879.1 restriction endonuclease subunit S [Mesorhizobium sp. M4A.F.Ca.ET.022.05.2.1]